MHARYWCTLLKISHRLALMNLSKLRSHRYIWQEVKVHKQLFIEYYFSGCKTKIKLKYEKYGLKWDHF